MIRSGITCSWHPIDQGGAIPGPLLAFAGIPRLSEHAVMIEQLSNHSEMEGCAAGMVCSHQMNERSFRDRFGPCPDALAGRM